MAITITRNTTLPDSSEKADFHNLIDTATISGDTLDSAYNGGNSITVDGGSFDLNGNITNPTLDVGQTGTGGGAIITNASTGHGVNVQQSGVLASSKYGLFVYSNAAQTTSELVKFHQDNSSSDQNVLEVINDGTAAAIVVDNNNTGAGITIDCGGNGAHLKFIGDPTVSSEDGEIWFDGSELKMNIGGTVYKFDKTGV